MKTTKKTNEKKTIAYRKTCDPKGTGLSHYILVDDKGTKKK
jgi:modified peptide precursor CbpA